MALVKHPIISAMGLLGPVTWVMLLHADLYNGYRPYQAGQMDYAELQQQGFPDWPPRRSHIVTEGLPTLSNWEVQWCGFPG